MPTDARYIFHEGDQALILDRRGRRYLVTLKVDKDDQNHLGTFHHDDIIGEPDGVRIWTSKGHALIVVKPGMADYIRIMPRVATVVYPKDIGAIITYGDIFPGARVLEAGTGSGALTIALARAVGERGKVFTYDIREDMTARARENLAAIMPEHPHVTFKKGDVSKSIPESDLDRIVLDLPEPWHIVPHAVDALVPGGVILSFLPTVLQVHELVMALEDANTFGMIETTEIFMRTWSVRGRSVRPDHRMIGHTGFITTARKTTPYSPPPSTATPDEEAEN
ncbi:MAG: tRNA (adenine-N1)-methyltransferase [Chloroflexota bacterium]|nr:tRNA (adenine-N1)-methyltransferase [Chloroflexota bacterium]